MPFPLQHRSYGNPNPTTSTERSSSTRRMAHSHIHRYGYTVTLRCSGSEATHHTPVTSPRHGDRVPPGSTGRHAAPPHGPTGVTDPYPTMQRDALGRLRGSQPVYAGQRAARDRPQGKCPANVHMSVLWSRQWRYVRFGRLPTWNCRYVRFPAAPSARIHVVIGSR